MKKSRSDTLLGQYTTKNFPSSRIPNLDLLNQGMKIHHVKGLLELDVTEAKDKILTIFEETGEKISFTGWLSYCVSQTLKEYPDAHAILQKQKRLYLFEDIDITLLIERDVNGMKVPLPYVLRKTQSKNLRDISGEIKTAQTSSAADHIIGQSNMGKYMDLYKKLPKRIRNFLWSIIRRKPLIIKKNMGTVAITSIGMFGNTAGWPIAIGIHPLEFVVGSIVEKPWIVDGLIVPRKILHLTVMFDHDSIDGAPAARFTQSFSKKVQNAYGL